MMHLWKKIVCIMFFLPEIWLALEFLASLNTSTDTYFWSSITSFRIEMVADKRELILSLFSNITSKFVLDILEGHLTTPNVSDF